MTRRMRLERIKYEIGARVQDFNLFLYKSENIHAGILHSLTHLSCANTHWARDMNQYWVTSRTNQAQHIVEMTSLF